MNASLPKGQFVVVQPPDLWVKWGLVPAGVTWTLDKAVYGLRESPFLWSQERDKQLTMVRWTVDGKSYRLRQGDADSQLWYLQEDIPGTGKILGLLVVYVDDFMLQAPQGSLRDSFLAALGSAWILAKEETLSVSHPITFLGIELELRDNSDLFLHQKGYC